MIYVLLDASILASYDVCTQSLTLGRPVPKIQQLVLDLLFQSLPSHPGQMVRRHPRKIASILGLLWNAGCDAPLCLYISR